MGSPFNASLIEAVAFATVGTPKSNATRVSAHPMFRVAPLLWRLEIQIEKLSMFPPVVGATSTVAATLEASHSAGVPQFSVSV